MPRHDTDIRETLTQYYLYKQWPNPARRGNGVLIPSSPALKPHYCICAKLGSTVHAVDIHRE